MGRPLSRPVGRQTILPACTQTEPSQRPRRKLRVGLGAAWKPASAVTAPVRPSMTVCHVGLAHELLSETFTFVGDSQCQPPPRNRTARTEAGANAMHGRRPAELTTCPTTCPGPSRRTAPPRAVEIPSPVRRAASGALASGAAPGRKASAPGWRRLGADSPGKVKGGKARQSGWPTPIGEGTPRAAAPRRWWSVEGAAGEACASAGRCRSYPRRCVEMFGAARESYQILVSEGDSPGRYHASTMRRAGINFIAQHVPNLGLTTIDHLANNCCAPGNF